MQTQKLKFVILCLVLLMAISCSPNLKVKTEIENWKQQLLTTKQIGLSYSSDEKLDHIKWMKENPEQLDGLPQDDKEIKAVFDDFDNDNKKDLLLYFLSENCTGHNGSPKTYATIIYSRNASNSDLMKEIILAIQTEYKQMRKKNKNLKDITDAYMNQRPLLMSIKKE